MTLIYEWKSVLLKAWSVRLLSVAALLQVLDLLGAFGDMLPFLQGVLPARTFQWLSILCTVAAFAARLIQQQGLSQPEDKAP
ncbi:MAG: hypothetical protein HOQ10_09500 [Frateuria sp.]|nr:hypothetical protein [Frateuria sp.]